jgi:hypothetical protein
VFFVSFLKRKKGESERTNEESFLEEEREMTDMEIRKMIFNSINPPKGLIKNIEEAVPKDFIRRFKKYNSLKQLDGRIWAIKKELKKGEKREKKMVLEKHILQGKRAIVVFKKNGMPSYHNELERLIKKEDNAPRAMAICFEMSSVFKEMSVYYRDNKKLPTTLKVESLSSYR